MRLAMLLLLLPTLALAQTFPARQISIVVPYSPGSTSDLIPRAIAPLLSQSMGVPVIVENRPGAGGNLLKRHPQALDVPTADESELPGFEVSVWYGFAAQAATPRPVVQKLNAEIARALRNPQVAERLGSLGLAIVADSPEDFARFVAVESDKMRKLVQASGARID